MAARRGKVHYIKMAVSVVLCRNDPWATAEELAQLCDELMERGATPARPKISEVRKCVWQLCEAGLVDCRNGKFGSLLPRVAREELSARITDKGNG